MTKDQDSIRVVGRLIEPFTGKEVKARVARCIPQSVTFSNHAFERMVERSIETTDIYNVMRAGQVHEGYQECVAGRWRYCMVTRKFRVVFVLGDDTVVIITAIRLEA